MSRRPVTSHDVARLAGVSRATVSIVLNRSDSATIGEATRRRVEAAAEELGYRPNFAGRMLKSGSADTVGLLISDEHILRVDAFIPILFWSLGRVIREAGFHLLLESLVAGTRGNPYTDLVESRRIDGLLVLSPREQDRALSELIESDFPLVIVGTIDHPREFSVNVRGSVGLAAAVERLVGLGHRRFGYVTFSPPGYVASERRVAAIRRTLAGHGLAMPDAQIRYGAFSAESGERAAGALIDAEPGLTAILAGNDTIAIGVLAALADRGRAVPDDISVVGFDDLPFAAYLRPALSTVRIDADWQGEAAARMLIARLKGEPIGETRQWRPGELLWRASAGPAP